MKTCLNRQSSTGSVDAQQTCESHLLWGAWKTALDFSCRKLTGWEQRENPERCLFQIEATLFVSSLFSMHFPLHCQLFVVFAMISRYDRPAIHEKH